MDGSTVVGSSASPIGWGACPGCGLVLPGGNSVERRRRTSAACWQLYGEVLAMESRHLIELGRFHQLTVDTYAAQHAGPPSPAISTAFALIGLALSLDEGWTGIQVRDAHQDLARRFDRWPGLDPPAPTWRVTVFDVAAAATPSEYSQLIERWATATWSAWQPAHAEIRRLLEERLPADVRGRLGSAS